MELCSKDLKTFVHENRQFAPHTTHPQDSLRFYRHVFKQILNGLISIHLIGWVNRDIHPDNILIVNESPQQIRDIHVKIADFGLARHIGKIPTDAKIKFKMSDNGSTVQPQFEQPSLAKCGFYGAPELLTGEYNHKVDVYSTGLVLYFISRYPEETEWLTELEALVKGELDINERLFYRDDEKLKSLIKNMLQKEPDERPNAKDVMAYMFPEEKDSTDAQETPKTKFYARKESAQDVSLCHLKKFTFSALKAEIKRRIQVKACNLRQEAKINGELKRVVIKDNEDVENIFQDAVRQGDDVVIVVIEIEDDSEAKHGYMSSGDVAMESVDFKCE